MVTFQGFIEVLTCKKADQKQGPGPQLLMQGMQTAGRMQTTHPLHPPDSLRPD